MVWTPSITARQFIPSGRPRVRVCAHAHAKGTNLPTLATFNIWATNDSSPSLVSFVNQELRHPALRAAHQP